MNRQQIKLYFNFHKSTLFVNWIISFAITLFFFSLKNFAITTFTAGFLIALFQKELTRRNEYFFYYNVGITKINLIIVNFSLNFLFAQFLIYISKLW